MPYLTQDQIDAYHRDGFLVLPGFASDAACDALMAQAGRLVDGFDADAHASVFSTVNQQKTSDDYFMSSGNQIRFFFEEEAFDTAGRLRQEKHLSINKIGHAMHDRDPVFDGFSRDARLGAIAGDIGMAKPLLMQSMYIFKQPHIGGEVVCHQDSTFLYTEPMSVVGFWFAVQDATLDNGCMWALPGGHKAGLKKRFNRAVGGGVTMEVLDDSPWPDCTPENGYVPLPAKRGTLILLHGLLPHLSGPNRSDKSRHAYTIHVVDGACGYPASNWLQRPADDPARGFTH
ncbi:phytanoyl-CoA dioxygenase family protein [Niveispirillum cyanobacteriorum]|uniref:Phytanoyl-CoA dioxygenase n=1 Tax=Niveispirillum cyanobacteriorum TaxID=1612173 RepID=A0A2K9NHR7_9PROT|nr:phytanoyl-CoA dioxygenase family protein [Niveispirillum cyanobacteriorum]AUN32116.1 phytanoyl-CoA dioxygenase [Niveispirillum cyanobacteriorum]GGE74336.1 phytanoyl-CoA dioxygenase [Niveispirillum cyanobacteriorum]